MGSEVRRSSTDTAMNGFSTLYKIAFNNDRLCTQSSFFAPHCLLVHFFLTITLLLMTTQAWLRVSGCVRLDLGFSEECFSRTEVWRISLRLLPEPAVLWDKLGGWQEWFFQKQIHVKNLITLKYQNYLFSSLGQVKHINRSLQKWVLIFPSAITHKT